MPDWAKLLDPDTLGLDDPTLIEKIDVSETTTRDDFPLVDVKVVLDERVTFEDLSWSWAGPIEEAISKRIRAEEGAGAPYVQFFTHEDWEAYLRGDEGQDDQFDGPGSIDDAAS